MHKVHRVYVLLLKYVLILGSNIFLILFFVINEKHLMIQYNNSVLVQLQVRLSRAMKCAVINLLHLFLSAK